LRIITHREQSIILKMNSDYYFSVNANNIDGEHF
jgi:hypothetical protein